jgi:hypothetical protein
MPIKRKDPPPASGVQRLDESILRVLTEPQRPVDVATRLNLPTHDVALRLRVLRQNGRVNRIRPATAPRNGPGSALYVRLEDE